MFVFNNSSRLLSLVSAQKSSSVLSSGGLLAIEDFTFTFLIIWCEVVYPQLAAFIIYMRRALYYLYEAAFIIYIGRPLLFIWGGLYYLYEAAFIIYMRRPLLFIWGDLYYLWGGLCYLYEAASEQSLGLMDSLVWNYYCKQVKWSEAGHIYPLHLLDWISSFQLNVVSLCQLISTMLAYIL